MTNNSEKDKSFIAGRQFRQVLPEKSEPEMEIKTEQVEIIRFIDIGNKRISVILEDFRGGIDITIKKQEFEDDVWQVCEQNIFTPIEIKALVKLLASFGSLETLTHKTNSLR